MRAAIYTRVSTHDQTTANQLAELKVTAERRGWIIIAEYTDEGISGAKGRDQRPGLDAMLNDAARRKFDLIMAWSVDRLGRSLSGLVATLGDLQSAGVNLYLHQQALDTTTPSGKAMFGMLGVFAEFERAMIQSRVKAGMARIRAEGRRPGPKGLAADDPERYTAIVDGLAHGKTAWAVHKETGVAHTTVLRIQHNLEREAA